MEIKTAKMMFDAGVYKSAVINRMPMSDGYMLTMNGTGKVRDILTGQRTGDAPREFSSIDAAVANAEKIGFKTVTVDLS